MAQVEAIRVEGLGRLVRDFGRMQKELRTGLQDELKEAAEIVAVEARAIAAAKGLRVSGDHIAGIRTFAKSSVVGVRAGATHRGFAYSKRLEYEGRSGGLLRGRGSYGPRASLMPALEQTRPEVHDRVDRVLDRIEDIFERSV